MLVSYLGNDKMNDYALAKLLHNEYESRFSNPDTNEKVQFNQGIRVAFAGVPVALAVFTALFF